MTHALAPAPRGWRWLLAFMSGIACAGGALAQPDNCESIRAQIESKIAASGVEQFTVTVVDANNTTASGQTVGTCALGTRRILYSRQVETGAPSAPMAPAAGTRSSPSMLTECRDGSTPVNGVCPR